MAFVREESKLGIKHECLRVVCGDALHPPEVENAVKGSEVVLSMLGPKGKPKVMAAESTRHIVNAMQTQGVKRLVAVCVPRLTETLAASSVRAFFGNPSPRMKVTRADLADFMLEQLTETQWLRQAPILRNE